MNDDYLWDRSGEPNEDVQELEDLLGTLRYQPKELAIPRDVNIGGRPLAYRIAAIAAAIALIAAGLGIWLIKQNSRPVVTANLQNPGTTPTAPVRTAAPGGQNSQPAILPGGKSEPERVSHPARRARVRHIPASPPRLSSSEIAEAETAKQQLLLALRVTSAKLSFVQKRTLNTVPANLIRNQHKIG